MVARNNENRRLFLDEVLITALYLQ